MGYVVFELINITKALSDENRVRILMALSHREELCVCQLIDLLGLAPSTVSKHLFLLRNARLIIGRKDGRWMHYRLNAEKAPRRVQDALVWLARSLSKDSIIQDDRLRLDERLSTLQSAGSVCQS